MRHVCPECGAGGEAGMCPTDKVARVPAGADTLLGETIGSWRVARVIGAGGMGRVYLAVQPKIGARVAIKVLRREAHLDRDLVERFFNEARAVNVIRHEGIVDIIDLGRLPDGAPYIVMEHLHGASLRALLRRDNRLPLGALAKIVGDVLAALAAAHAKGIIHRDLKPDNVFVSPGGRVTVLDFGIAKLAGAEPTPTTRTGSLLGTPAYMSPEQARAHDLDARADLYSLGVILYEGATGALPFNASSLYELLDMHVKAAPESPRAKNDQIPEALQAVILRALSKDAADRFATANEMRRALADAVADLPEAAFELPSVTRDLAPVIPFDPLAATAATRDTSASIAHSETLPSTPGRASEPVITHRSRVAFGAMAAVTLLAIGAAAAMFLRGDRDRPPPQPPIIVATSDTMVAADTPTAIEKLAADAAPAIDAAPVIDAARPKPRPVVEPPPDLEQGAVTLAVGNPRRFDPVAFIKTATAKAEWGSRGKVRLIGLTFRQFDKSGLIDLGDGGSAYYGFVITDPKTEWCYLTVLAENDGGQMFVGRPTESGAKCGGGVVPPRCTLPQMWQKAIDAGMPPETPRATVNRWGPDQWVFSWSGGESKYLKDDCGS